MYKVNIAIEGTAPILHHKFGGDLLTELQAGSKRKTGSTDYSLEWMETMYAGADGYLFQPAAHIEGALVKAGSRFTIKGQKGRTYKDLTRAYAIVMPEEIPLHYDGQRIAAPDESLLLDPRHPLRVSVMRVVVQRSAVARARLEIAAGWQLAFMIDVVDDQLRPEVLREILDEAGRAVGIGDFRPRYGRFQVTRFDVLG